MNDFQFHNTTKVYFGKDQLGHLHEEVLKYGKSVLVVYGGGSIKKNGLYDKVMKELKDNNIEVYELAGVEPNPRHTTVNKGAKICKENNITAIPYKAAFKQNHVFSDKVDNFTSDNFWGGYNIIEPTESLEHAVNKLKKQQKQ